VNDSPWLAARLRALEQLLDGRFGSVEPMLFREAVRYPVFGGGKRIRPAAVFAAFEAVSGSDDPAPAMAAAAAVELVHTYSLVHDDLPSMDNDDLRRGRPTVHKVYGDGAAILVGDGLLTEAFSLLASAPHAAEVRIEMVRALAAAAGNQGMVGGQAWDIGMGGPITDVATLERLHQGKTGAMFVASALLGGLAGGANEHELRELERWATDVGLAFQLADDVLDADQDHKPGGPPSFVRLIGVEETEKWARLLVEGAVARVADLKRPQHLVSIAWFAIDRGF
jgi:geranylgeranyl pyrophosphate synthase